MTIFSEISFISYVYPPGRVRPVVNVVAVLIPAVCVAGRRVARGRIFIGKSKHHLSISSMLLFHEIPLLNDVVTMGLVFA